MMLPSALLAAAKAAVIGRGWCQHVGVDPATGAVCAIGAIDVAVVGNRSYSHCSAEMCLEEAIQYDSIPRWNDRPERTLEDVIAAFNDAIAIALQHESAEQVASALTTQEQADAILRKAPR